MSGAKILFQSLVKYNVKHVFGYPGGAILPVLNEFYNQDSIKYILSRTESGGSFMAEGYAKVTKKPGVIMVTSGPGAINIMTSLQNALSDGTPLLALTGQVSTTVIGTDAFQEADVIGISKACTKWNTLITDSSKIQSSVDIAFAHMLDKRHGPVLLDLPKNIMSMVPEPQQDLPSPAVRRRSVLSTITVEEIRELIMKAKRPVVLVGQGVLQADAVSLLRQFISIYKLPVTTTLMALGAVDERERRSLKMLGMHGSYVANMAIQNCDLLLNFGSRFDDRIIGNPSMFAPKATIVHVDILFKNINKTISTKLYRTESCKDVLQQLVTIGADTNVDVYQTYQWWKQLHAWKKTGFTYPTKAALQGRQVLAALNTLIQADSHSYTIVSDVGAHQMWAAQFIDYNAPRVRFITSGGLGTMGFALPASIGVKIGAPDDRVICVCGDGGFLMTFQELVTAIENGIGIKVLILNNNYQLMVKIWQEKFYNGQIVGTKMNNPPFELVCQALGCRALRVDSANGLEDVLKSFLEYSGPIVLNVITDSEESVLPMVAPGKGLDDMILEGSASDSEPGSGDAPC
jgi:acetolactate synthase-1/2/3 large subunit